MNDARIVAGGEQGDKQPVGTVGGGWKPPLRKDLLGIHAVGGGDASAVVELVVLLREELLER